MASKKLLPGFGGKNLDSVAGGGSGSDLLDCSAVASLAFQVTSQSGNGTTITVEETFDGTNYATLTTFSAVLGTIKKLTFDSGPFGVIRLSQNGSTGAAGITVVGATLPVGT